MRDRVNRTTHSYYPKPIREEPVPEKEQDLSLDKGLTTLQAENNHEKRAEAYRSSGGGPIANIDLSADLP